MYACTHEPVIVNEFKRAKRRLEGDSLEAYFTYSVQQLKETPAEKNNNKGIKNKLFTKKFSTNTAVHRATQNSQAKIATV